MQQNGGGSEVAFVSFIGGGGGQICVYNNYLKLAIALQSD